jgi:hypothetical protein
MGVAMAYITKHVRRDGTVEVTVNDGGKKATMKYKLGEEPVHAPSKFVEKKEIVYNMSRLDNDGKFLGAAARTAQIKKNLANERELAANRSKGQTKKTHWVPSELYHKVAVEQGREAAKDHAYMKRVAEAHGFKL